jgi:hypothetical protein
VLTLESGLPALRIEKMLTNEGNEPLGFAWGHHPLLCPPFLDHSCWIDAPPALMRVA